MDAFLVGIAGLAAAFAGILIGFWLRGTDARAIIASLEQRIRDMADALAKSRSDTERNLADTTARAAFESLATEREKIIGQMTAEQDRLRAEVQAKADAERTQAARLSELEADLRNEKEKASASLALLENTKQALAGQIESIVTEVIDKQSRSLSGDSQGELLGLLSPLREQLNEFREKIERAQLDSHTGVTKLETLIGALGGLNQQVAQEARNLSTALRGSPKAHSGWGEFILRDLLEKAGLREGDQYSFQQSFRDTVSDRGEERGAKQTDVIVHLPGGRHLVIDSRVPLNAYADSVSAELEEDRAAAAREHLKSVRDHVAGVAKANFHGIPGIQTPDFVVMFVPIEPALLEALRGDPELWADAYQKAVLLAGPTTLLYVVRIVSILWRQEDHNRAMKELTDHGAALYARFAEFVTDMDSLGESLRHTTARYHDAQAKLTDGRNNLVSQFEEFKQLGAQPTLAGPAQPVPIQWGAAAEDSGLPGSSGEDSRRLELPAETNGYHRERAQELELAAETNGYHRERAQELELEEAPYSIS